MFDPPLCKQLWTRLIQGEAIASAHLKSALSDIGWDAYVGACEQAKMNRRDAKIASHVLRDYVRLLRIADLCNANRARRRARGSKMQSRREQPSAKYERALERLAALVDIDAAIADFLDRPFSSHMWRRGSPAADDESVPRIKYHTGQFVVQNDYFTLKTNRQLKLECLSRELSAWTNEASRY